MTVRKLRTINNCINEIRNLDADTDVTYYAITNLVLSHKVYYIKSGNRCLVDLDDVIIALGLYKEK